MLARMLFQSWRFGIKRKLLAIITIFLAAGLVSALLAVSIDIGDKMAKELKSYGANILVEPASNAALPDELTHSASLYSQDFLDEKELPNIKDIFWRNNIVGFAPLLSANVQVTKSSQNSTALSGNMNISLLRIDDRLIHGQVATSWAKAVKCEAIFAISDEVAEDALRRELLLQIAPAHLKAYVIPVEKAIKVYHNPKYAGKNILWLVTKPADVVRLVEGGVKIDKVNVGGMTYKDGNKQLSDAVTVGKADVEAFKKLLDLGIDLSMQKVASNPRVELTRQNLDAINF